VDQLPIQLLLLNKGIEMSNTSVKVADFEFVTIEEAARPLEGVVSVLLHRWWLTDDQGRIAFYRPSAPCVGGGPQCNPSVAIANHLVEKYEWATGIEQIPIVFRAINVEDYT